MTQKRRRQITDRVVIVTMILAAAVFAIWPVGATWWNNWKAYQFSQTAIESTSNIPEDILAAELERAHEYNRTKVHGSLGDPVRDGSSDSAEYQDYLDQINLTETMGAVRIPSIDLSLPIRHGTSEQSLGIGAGHVFGTSLPVGGEGTNTAITAHRGLPKMTGFDRLPEMKKGDLFFLDVLGQTLAYKVTDIQTVLPNDMQALNPVSGKDLATLITCTPYGVNSHRILVIGERVSWSVADKEAQEVKYHLAIQHWMYGRLVLTVGSATLVLVLCSVWNIKDIRNRHQKKSQ